MKLSGLWTRKSSPKGDRQEPFPPCDVRETRWRQLRSKIHPRRGHKAIDLTTPLDGKVSARTSTHQTERHFLPQIALPHPFVHPHHPPTPSSPSQENALAPPKAVYSSSYRQVSEDRPFMLLSECETRSSAPTKADAFGVVPSADCHAPILDVEENDGENIETPSSLHIPPVPSSDTVKGIEASEINPIDEPSSAFAPEPLDFSTLFGDSLASESLKAASVVQAKRRRLRAQTRRALLVAQDLADSDFPLANLNVLGFSGPAETGTVAVDESAGGSFSADAPVPSDNALYEVPSEPVVQSAPFALEATAQPPELDASSDTETNDFHPTPRDSLASSSSSHSLFEYDNFLSDPLRAVEPPPSLNPAEDGNVECERAVYDPILQCFSLPKVNTLGLTGPNDNDARNVDKERIESARVKETSLTPVAPTPFTHVSRAENCKVVITVTPPTPPGTMRLPRDQAIEHAPFLNPAEDRDLECDRSVYDPILQCFSLPKVKTLGLTAPTENDAQNVHKERIESARVKETSLTPVAPAPFTHVSGSENCKIVITVTPPTPLGTMRLPRDQVVNDGMINPNNSHLVLPNPRRSKSSPRSDHSAFVSEMPPITGLADSHPPPFRIDRDEEVGLQHPTQLRVSNYTVSTVVTGSVEGENCGLTAPVRGDTLFKPRHLRSLQTFGSSLTLVDQLPPHAATEIIRLSGSAGDHFRVVDGEGPSAGDKAKPSSFDAPILPTPGPRRKLRKGKESSEGLVRSHVHRHPRTFKSRIASSLRDWGNAVSRLFTVQRPAEVGENETFSPYFDPWEGFVPPRGPSPDLIQPGVDFSPPRPSIKNIYVKLDI